MIDLWQLIFEPMFWLMVAPFAIIGAIAGYMRHPAPGNQVTVFMPKTRTAYDLDTEMESAHVLYTEQIKGLPNKRFYKWKDGYDVREGNKVFTRYLATEGKILTTDLLKRNKEGQDEEIPTDGWLRTVLGQEVFKRLTNNERIELAKATIPITIDVDKDYPDETPSWLQTMTEDNFWEAFLERIPEEFAERMESARESKGWRNAINTIFAMGSGALLMALAFLLKLIRM